ncbi:MAG: glycoside hydrolase family 16 protein [Acidobacteriota bacterium]|nr:glycoside hydrolase family 16 protein [Acidobacteriota bacterium]
MTGPGSRVNRGAAIRAGALALALIVAAIPISSAAAHPIQGAHCFVPNLRGYTLADARRVLRAAHCTAGLITGPRVNSHVRTQLPTRGASEFVDTRVALTMRSRSVSRAAPRRGSAGSAAVQPLGISGTWKLVLDSEFTHSSYNNSIWRTGWGSDGISVPSNTNELDCYSPANVYVGGGSLHLDVTARPSACGGTTLPYTGAMITTNPDRGRSGGFQYTYGVAEARVYLPAAGSLIANWPGFWGNGQSWPADGENDVMEGLSGVICWSFHNPAGMTHGCDRNITPGWHTFASDWRPGSITYYYDGIDVGVVTAGVTSAPMYLILDNTVHNNQQAVTIPASMQVQYVRVWQSG